MITVETRIFIKRSQQEVFDFVSDPSNNAKWQRNTQSAEWTSDGPPGIGSTFKTVYCRLGRNLEGTAEITTLEPPNSFTVKTVRGPIPLEFTYHFKAQGDGSQMTYIGLATSAESLVAAGAQRVNGTLTDRASLDTACAGPVMF